MKTALGSAEDIIAQNPEKTVELREQVEELNRQMEKVQQKAEKQKVCAVNKFEHVRHRNRPAGFHNHMECFDESFHSNNAVKSK